MSGLDKVITRIMDQEDKDVVELDPASRFESVKWVDESFFKESEVYQHQKQIRNLHNKIDKLQKRLDDTKAFCDSLWEQLKDYEQ